MKRFFYIMFISTTVFFSFGFRGCDELFCSFIGRLSSAAYHTEINVPRKTIVGDDGEVYSCPPGVLNCACGLILLSTYNLNEVDNYEGSNGDIGKSGNSVIVIVGDTGTVFFSPDGGETREDRSIPTVTENLYGLDFFSQGTGFEPGLVVCGQTGSMYYSTDSGLSWAAVNTTTSENLNSVAAIDKTLFIVVGDGGTILKTYDRGDNWENHTVGGAKFNKIFDGIEVEAYGYLWIAGDNGRIYATTNYGISWVPQNSGVTENLNDIQFRNQNEGIVVGDNCTIRHTVDGGTTWVANSYFDSLCTEGDIIDIETVDFNTGMALIRNTTSDGVTTTKMVTVSSEPLSVDDDNNIIPLEYSLEQNFPNPFNPSTTIQFSIPEQSFVTLEVFNALGEKVTTLVSKELNAGNHKYEWSPETQPGGIYFYKLSTNSFQQTKKLVLLK